MKILKEENSEDKILFKTNWVSVLETQKGFQYLERKGKNSIAVFLLRKGIIGDEVLIRYQPLPILNNDESLFPCPITGSIEENETLTGTVIREVLEETGYNLKDKIIAPLGEYIVGTQTDEVVYMYFCDVSNLTPEEIKGDGSYHESISKNIWEPIENLKMYNYAACQIGYFRLNDILNSY